MNKRDLIDALSGRLGDKKSATEALNAVLETIQSAVADGDKVAITGFGVFEKSERPARTARNPATGAEIHVAAQSVPKFRPVPTSRRWSTEQGGRGEEAGGQDGCRQEEVTARRQGRRSLAPGEQERTAARGLPGAAMRCLRRARRGKPLATASRARW